MSIKPLPAREICRAYVKQIKELAKGDYDELLILSPSLFRYPTADNYDNHYTKYSQYLRERSSQAHWKFLSSKQSKIWTDETVSDYMERHAALMLRLYKLLRKFKKVRILTDANTFHFEDVLFGELRDMKNVEIRFTTALHENIIFVNGQNGIMPSAINGIGQRFFFLQNMDEANAAGAYSFVKEIWDKDAIPYSIQTQEEWVRDTEEDYY